jgi:DNA-binding MarR family transcriptional regulator
MLRRAWVGYQRRLDDAMAEAGFTDRSFPDARVLRVCRDAEMTIAGIGRELGITRQGAAKVVARLTDRGYVRVAPSAASGREKTVILAARGAKYLDAQRDAARRIDQQLRRRVGAESFDALRALCEVLAPQEDARMREYLHEKGVRDI